MVLALIFFVMGLGFGAMLHSAILGTELARDLKSLIEELKQPRADEED